jgi:hypothetical protein
MLFRVLFSFLCESVGLHARYFRAYTEPLEKVWNEAERDSKTEQRVAPEVDFVSTAVPVEGAVDYREMKWESFSRVVETPEQFTFYSGRSIAKVIPKPHFKDHREIVALRRVIRRHVAANELLDA